ncbi:hypothetical protein DPMN_078300 [Dreissena polymorpha]|uniref:Uncharacterized protein n=1 Tax=Dreissena polymorpha TaxID=45954 RepID=A0A9D3YQA1_DREPO|nr:hypothetical protein DPMN_078300 [Dreissena polymorpha]
MGQTIVQQEVFQTSLRYCFHRYERGNQQRHQLQQSLQQTHLVSYLSENSQQYNHPALRIKSDYVDEGIEQFNKMSKRIIEQIRVRANVKSKDFLIVLGD